MAPLGAARKTFGVVERALIVVAENRLIEPQHAVDALPRVGSVAHDIAQAIHAIDAFAGHIGLDGFERLEVGVDIADDRSFHGLVGQVFNLPSRVHESAQRTKCTGRDGQ